MAAPYTTVTVTGYNDNPPPDDGSESEENRVLWETIKEKLPDPLKTAIEAIDAGVIAAFLKVIGGGGVVSSAISATIGASDQGKLYRATGSGTTITTPDATSVTSPFVVGFLNSSTGTVTLDGSASQTVNGVASVVVPIGGGGLLFTDGSNWFLVGLGGVLAGKQLMYGDIINGTIVESNGTNAATFALKTLAGADPSTDDPVLICFRNATAATGDFVYRTVTAALSVVIPSGATLGAVNATAFDVVVALFDDGGTIRLGVMNPTAADGTTYAVAQVPPIASSTTIGTGSDSAKTWYTGTGVTSKAYVVLGIARYTGGPGLTTAGSWNVSPTTLQPFGPGIPLPNVALHHTAIPARNTVKAFGQVLNQTLQAGSFNVASVTDNGANHTITFTNPMANALYAVLITPSADNVGASDVVLTYATLATGSFVVVGNRPAVGLTDPDSYCFMVLSNE